MAVHGKATGVVWGGYDLTRMLNTITVAQKTDATDATMFQADGMEYVVGLSDATVDGAGRYEGDLNAARMAVEDALDQDTLTPVLVVLGGWVVGNRVRLGQELSTKFDVASPVAGLVTTALNLQTSGAMDAGVLLLGPAESSASVVGATQDNGAATAAGGTVQVHVTENTRSTNSTVTLQHSVDGTTWVDLAVLPTVAAGALSGVQQGVTGTIYRYTRITTTLTTGTGLLVTIAALMRS